MVNSTDPDANMSDMAATLTMTPHRPAEDLGPDEVEARFLAKLERQRAGIVDPIISTVWSTVLTDDDRAALEQMVEEDAR